MNKKIKVLITGSSRGIGKSIAKILAQSGFDVILHGRNEDVLKIEVSQIGAIGYVISDLTVDGAVENMCEKIKAEFGAVDVIVNNAGEYIWSPVEKTKDEDIFRLIKLNTEVPYKLIKIFVPGMKKNKFGRIINIGSISGAVGEANASLYSLTKSAFAGLTKALALELAQDGITVNTINPGWVDTELTKDACAGQGFSEEENIEMIPQRRFIHPDEVANLVKYLISEEAKGLTGQCINLCAGLSVG